MNEKVTKQLNTYKRSIENKRFQSSAYSVILLFTIIAFDIIGLQSMVDITVRRFKTLGSLNNLIEDLQYKSDDIDLLKQKLEESQYYLSMLDEAVPSEPKVEKYMVSLVQTAAKHGYRQERLVKGTNQANYVEVRATFKGSQDQLEPFIESIENQDRLLLVESFHYSVVEDTVNLEVVIRIFYLYR